MARSGQVGDLVYYGAVIGGGWIALNMAQQGTFGAAAQRFATDLKNGIRGSAPSIAVGAGGVRVALPTGGTTAAPSSPVQAAGCGFITGVRYVAPLGDGTFETVNNGARVFRGSQSEAEAYYRAHVCGG